MEILIFYSFHLDFFQNIFDLNYFSSLFSKYISDWSRNDFFLSSQSHKIKFLEISPPLWNLIEDFFLNFYYLFITIIILSKIYS